MIIRGDVSLSTMMMTLVVLAVMLVVVLAVMLAVMLVVLLAVMLAVMLAVWLLAVMRMIKKWELYSLYLQSWEWSKSENFTIKMWELYSLYLRSWEWSKSEKYTVSISSHENDQKMRNEQSVQLVDSWQLKLTVEIIYMFNIVKSTILFR